jgi:hypothetical protein
MRCSFHVQNAVAVTHQGRWCFGKMQTFLDAMAMAKEKNGS